MKEDRLKFEQTIKHERIRSGIVRRIKQDLFFDGRFAAQLVRNGRVIKTFEGHNDVVIQGKNHILDVCFGNSTPVTQVNPWYIGLVDQSPTPVLSENDTLASHSGWTEFASYSGNRKPWDDANAASKVKGTTTTSDFTIGATGELHGILICSVASGTSGILWSTGSFDAPIDVINTDVIKITYGLRC